MIERDQIVDCLRYERVAFLSEHEVVRYANRNRLGKDDRVDEQAIQRPATSHVKVEVNASIVVEDEITDSVCALDRICVRIVRVYEPGVFVCDEFS